MVSADEGGAMSVISEYVSKSFDTLRLECCHL